MQENTNTSRLGDILNKNGGYITRRQVDQNGIKSWFLTDFVRKKNLKNLRRVSMQSQTGLQMIFLCSSINIQNSSFLMSLPFTCKKHFI